MSVLKRECGMVSLLHHFQHTAKWNAFRLSPLFFLSSLRFVLCIWFWFIRPFLTLYLLFSLFVLLWSVVCFVCRLSFNLNNTVSIVHSFASCHSPMNLFCRDKLTFHYILLEWEARIIVHSVWVWLWVWSGLIIKAQTAVHCSSIKQINHNCTINTEWLCSFDRFNCLHK